MVNYHKVDLQDAGENMTYSSLGAGSAQAADAKAGRTGADLQLKDARIAGETELILAVSGP